MYIKKCLWTKKWSKKLQAHSLLLSIPYLRPLMPSPRLMLHQALTWRKSSSYFTQSQNDLSLNTSRTQGSGDAWGSTSSQLFRMKRWRIPERKHSGRWSLLPSYLKFKKKIYTLILKQMRGEKPCLIDLCIASIKHSTGCSTVYTEWLWSEWPQRHDHTGPHTLLSAAILSAWRPEAVCCRPPPAKRRRAHRRNCSALPQSSSTVSTPGHGTTACRCLS